MNESEPRVSVGTGVIDLSKDNNYLFKLRNLKDKEPCWVRKDAYYTESV